MAHSYTNLLVHVVFSTKNRAKDLTGERRADMWIYLADVAKNVDSQAPAVGGGVDHVHLLLRYPAAASLSDIVKKLKSNSSRWMREQHNPHFVWQNGYAAFSVSQSRAAEVAAYIDGQEAHHKRVDFEDEYVSLLKRNEIRFEAERLWGSQG
jgi:putative transposase